MPPSFTDPLPSASRPTWLRLTDLLIAVLLVLAIALVTSFLATPSVHARNAGERHVGFGPAAPRAEASELALRCAGLRVKPSTAEVARGPQEIATPSMRWA